MMETNQNPKSALILIVDDDATTRALLRRLLQVDGYQTAEAQDGLQAIAQCQKLLPNMVLLDAVMPKMGGFEACTRLQKLPGSERRPVLMITNLDDPESINQAFAAGASDYITKPIQWPVLRQRVRWMVRATAAEEAFQKIYDELVSLNTAYRSEQETRQRAEARQHALEAGLRTFTAGIGGLLASTDQDELFKRAIEVAREHLGLDRAAIFVKSDDHICGTYGTDRSGHTTDERAQRFPKNADWLKRFRLLSPPDTHWILDDEAYLEWDGTKAVSFGRGWIAVTLIQSGEKTIGFFINDAAITHLPIDPAKQEVIVAYCSLLGSILDHKHYGAG